MGASIHLIGIDKVVLAASFGQSSYFSAVDDVDMQARIRNGQPGVKAIAWIFYYLADKTDAAGLKDLGLELLYTCGIKKHCFELWQMFGYYSAGFRWDGPCDFEVVDASVVLTREQTLALLDWYIALCRVFNTDPYTMVQKVDLNTLYIDKANCLKREYNSEYEYFGYALDVFIALRAKVADMQQENFLWTYSF